MRSKIRHNADRTRTKRIHHSDLVEKPSNSSRRHVIERTRQTGAKIPFKKRLTTVAIFLLALTVVVGLVWIVTAHKKEDNAV